MEETRKKMGIYIDVDNVEKGSKDYRDEGIVLDYAELISEISDGYDLVVLKGYDCEVNDTSGFNVRTFLEGMGITAELTKPQVKRDLNGVSTLVQKEVDTGICTDVSFDVLTGKVDVAVIVSGDRDMYPPVDRAAKCGKDVRVYALENTIQPEYADALGDRLTYIDDLMPFLMTSDETSQPDCNTCSVAISREAVANE